MFYVEKPYKYSYYINRYGYNDYTESLTRTKRIEKHIRESIANDTNIQNLSPIDNRYGLDLSTNQVKYYTRFKRFPILDPYNMYDGVTEYVFFTKPDFPILNGNSLIPDVSKNPLFTYALMAYKPILSQLQSSSTDGSKCKFIPFLSNAISSTIDLPDLDASDMETAANINGTRIYYKGNTTKSNENFDLSIEFEDSIQADVYMFFRLWDEIRQMDLNGQLTLENYDRWFNYIINKVMFDNIDIFKIVVGSDGYTILYWAELVGCYPKGTPRSVWSDTTSLTGYMKITTQWKCHFVKDLDITSLIHFNRLSVRHNYIPVVNTSIVDFPLFNKYSIEPNRRWALRPYICKLPAHQANSKGRTHPYQLRWTNSVPNAGIGSTMAGIIGGGILKNAGFSEY